MPVGKEEGHEIERCDEVLIQKAEWIREAAAR
jgi:hypothetical protein